jgi:hypothetical protein
MWPTMRSCFSSGVQFPMPGWLGDGLPVDEIGGGRRSPSHVLCGVSLLNDRRPSKEPDTWAH